jgi:hypothetical protein
MIRVWLKKKWVRTAALVAGCVVLVYAMIYIDVVLRARSAYLEGEKYWSWHENPALKGQALEAEFSKAKGALDKKFAAGRLPQDEYKRQLDILTFTREQRQEESSIKYAYIWYQTAVELFSPPESKWVRLSREKMPRAKELWKQELRAKNIPFEEYMLE